jgi:TatD DNase family protein
VIIDSHAHYAHKAFSGEFSYLAEGTQGFEARRGDLAALFGELKAAGIAASIEPGVTLASNEAILAMSRDLPIFPAVGVHPTRAVQERWRDRRALEALSRRPGVVAVGEIGLDYHLDRSQQHRIRQLGWFVYQLELARKRDLPVILHVRDAHPQALRVLRHYRGKLRGVAHCFSGDEALGREYVALGWHLGIGGTLLQTGVRAERLRRVVEVTPLERLLPETDSPFILPDCSGTIPGKARRRMRNTSLILPAVIREVAAIKGIPEDRAREALTRNVIALFRLPLTNEDP